MDFDSLEILQWYYLNCDQKMNKTKSFQKIKNRLVLTTTACRRQVEKE